MKLTLKHVVAAILLMLSLAAPVAAGPLEDGYTAYTRGDFATAMRLMRPLADQGNITAQTVVGLMYYFNYGGPRKRIHVVQSGGGAGQHFRRNVSKRYRRQDDPRADSRSAETRTRVEAEYAVAFSLETREGSC